MNLHVVYRTCAAESTAPRPAFFSRVGALASLKRAADSATGAFASVTWTFVADGAPPAECRALMADLGQIVSLAPPRGNGGSYSAVVALATLSAWDDADIVYVVEDDYLHEDEALLVLASAAAALPDRYFTLYDHPDYYTLGVHQRFSRRFDGRQLGAVLWRPVRSTCLTFATSVGQLRVDAWIHMLAGRSPVPDDFRLWGALTRHGGNRVAGMLTPPGSMGDVAVIRRAIKRAVLGVASPGAASRTTLRPLLWAPRPGSATHLVEGLLAAGVDWTSVAADAQRSISV